MIFSKVTLSLRLRFNLELKQSLFMRHALPLNILEHHFEVQVRVGTLVPYNLAKPYDVSLCG